METAWLLILSWIHLAHRMHALFPLVGTYREVLPSCQWLGMFYMNANIRGPIVTTYINDVLHSSCVSNEVDIFNAICLI